MSISSLDELSYSDHFFAYADNTLYHYDPTKLKSLMNFYMLFTGRLIITDSFLVNNPNLEILFNQDPNGFSAAIEKGFILPAMRTNISNLKELHANFVEKSDAQTNLTYINHIQQSIKQNISWELSDIEVEFTNGLLSTINSEQPLYGKIDKLIHNGLRDDLTHMYESQGKFTRLDLTNLINNKYKSIDLPASKLLLGMISTKYQTNIPDLLKIEIAYPESPESLVSGLDLIKESRLIQSNNQYDVSKLTHEFNSVMFDTGLLSSLTFEQMSHIKNLSEHQAFVHSWNRLIEDSLTGDTASSYNTFVASLDKYNSEIDKLLPMLFNKATTQHYLQNKKRLKVLNTIHKGMEIVNTALDFIPIHDSISDGLDIAEKLFGKYISNKQTNHDYWVREQTAASSDLVNKNKSNEKLLLPRGISSSDQSLGRESS